MADTSFNSYLEEDELKKLQDQAAENNTNVGYIDAFNTVGTALAGKQQSIEPEKFQAQNAQIVKDYLLKKQAARQAQEQEQADTKFSQEQSDNNSFRDPNSKLATAARRAMQKLGYDVDPNTSLYDFKRQGIDPFKMWQDEKETRMKVDATRAASIKTESNRDLIVPGVGEALTREDAKTLKDAATMKSKLDSQIQQMIDLRKQYGSEVMNREAVARGQQLSKDLLLTYKNLSKLGVLSKSDEDIVNAIIPADPLEFTPFSSATGQDPIIAKLEAFKTDNSADFEQQMQKRLLKRYNDAPQQIKQPQQEQEEVKQFFKQFQRQPK